MNTDQKWRWGLVAALALVGGCVERTMTIQSDPPGALVFLNGQEVGRTPLTRDFIWYGDYDVRMVKDGYEPLVTHRKVTSVSYDMPPFDLVAELLPFTLKDHHEMDFTLTPATQPAGSEQNLVERAQEMRTQLESSQYTRQPAK